MGKKLFFVPVGTSLVTNLDVDPGVADFEVIKNTVETVPESTSGRPLPLFIEMIG
jgi:hypothetical protein